ncbi:MAG TPA: vWA domain-containing protein [Opitutaceae bacterium]|nr:vWA domain-containing protein [Opitutaceae bacterium]
MHLVQYNPILREDAVRRPALRRFSHLLLFNLVIIAFAVLTASLHGASSVTASKDCTTSPSTVVEGSFSIATPQIIAWQATYNPVGGCNGDSFFLSQVDSAHADIALTTSGALSGTQFLNPGTYHISIRTFAMGSGSYTVTFNRTASIAASPNSHDFGSELENDSSTGSEIKTFNITKSGDLDIANVTASVDGASPFFTITNAPGSTPPTSLKVAFNAGTISGSATTEVHSGVIRVKANSNPAGVTVADVLINVSGTTVKREPNIAFVGTNPSPIRANFVTGDHVDFDVIFKNTGSKDLQFTGAVALSNDTTPGVFTVVTAAGTNPLPAGQTRAERVRFTPPPTSTQDQPFNGHIDVFSNDPDHPTFRCDFTGIAHEPRPVIRIEPSGNVLNYHDVELGFAYDLPLIVHNDGDAPLVFDVSEADPADPDRPQWESLSTPTGTTIAAGGAASILVQRFHPQAVGGPYNLTLRVHGTNHPSLPPPTDVTLIGTGTAPIPVNSVLVLDRSGSMADSAGPTSKIGALRIAGQMWADMLRPETGSGLGDAVGLVKYNNTNDEYAPLQLLTTAHRNTINTAFDPAAIGDIARLKPDNGTGIGGGMQRGADMLRTQTLEPSGSEVRKHVMVVMTDGIENVDPRINQVLPNITNADNRLRIYSLGLGNDLDLPKLQSITNRANGFHQVTGDLAGTQRFDLQTFYFKILVDTLDWQLVVDPTFAVDLAANNPTLVSTAHVCSSDLSAMFVVMDEPSLRGYYDLQLLDPNGNVMIVGASVGGVPVQIIERENYRILKVVFPDLSLASSYIGDWKLLLVPNGKWKPRGGPSVGTHGNTPPAGGDPVFNGYNGLVPIGFGAAVGSNYRLDAQVAASAYEPNATITMTASLSDRQWPSVTGSVTVDVTKPDGTVAPGIILYDDGTHGDAAAGDGTWTNLFGQTAQSGSYKFFYNAIGHNDRGELAPRQATRYVSLVPPGRGDDGDGNNGGGRPGSEGCFSCRTLRLLWTIVLALLALIVLLLLFRRKSAP